MGEVRSLIQPGAQQLSPELTEQVRGIRSFLAIAYDSDDVVTEPMTQSYDAFIGVNGAVRLGAQGMEDFEARFGGLRQHSIQPERLYVGYMAVRRALSDIRKPSIDDLYHRQLLAIARDVRKSEKRFNRVRDLHNVETEIIGYHAARIAMVQSSSAVHPEARRSSLRAAIKLNAERRVPKPSGEIPQEVKYRKSVLGHFTLDLSAFNGRLDRALQDSVRRRS